MTLDNRAQLSLQMSDLTITYHKHFIVELSANRSTFQLKPRKHLTQVLRPDRAVLEKTENCN